jgi:hypothetical protein
MNEIPKDGMHSKYACRKCMKNSANQKCQNDNRKLSSAATPPHHQVKFFLKNQKLKIFKNNA